MGLQTNQCCCPCDCCNLDQGFTVFSVIAEYSSLILGNTTGDFGEGTISLENIDPTACGNPPCPEGTCFGRADFTIIWQNGACQRSETTCGYACMHRALTDFGWCCYWEVFFTKPDTCCEGQDPGPDCLNLNDGWPGDGPVTIPFCLGSNVPQVCGTLLPTEPCFNYCSADAAGFSFVDIATDLSGDCQCDDDEEEV